jgi:hypothetical protein
MNPVPAIATLSGMCGTVRGTYGVRQAEVRRN